MSKRSKERESKQRIVQMLKRRLISVIAFLAGTLLVFLFRIGEAAWPFWMAENRMRIAAFLILAIICIVITLPLMIEASSNTSTLSGPGKNPKGPRLE